MKKPSFKNTPTFIITIASGKGGVGKSTIAANLGAALTQHFDAVLLLDANFRSPSLHVLVAADPPLRLSQYDPAHFSATQLLHSIAPNLELIAGAPGDSLPPPSVLEPLLGELQRLHRHEIILIDTAAGITPELNVLIPYTHLLILVSTDEPTSIVDTYGLLKYLTHNATLPLTTLLFNMIVDQEDAKKADQTLNAATQRFLNLHIPMLGFIPYDRTIRRAILNQTLLHQFDPFAASTRAFVQLSTALFRFIVSVQKKATA